DGVGLSNDGHECFVLELTYAPQNQDRRKMAEDFYKLLREMRDLLHASKKEKHGLGYKIPKEVLQMTWAFKKRVTSANEVWNSLESQYETITTSESSDDGDNFMKASPN
ncbi:15513_t:CDS:2, partial [Entrophospora sp. SA101]